jgi:TusA-related sulfurtransferase
LFAHISLETGNGREHNLRRKKVATVLDNTLVVDAKGLLCPMPIIKLSQAINLIGIGQTLALTATDPGSQHDIAAWARQTRHELVDTKKEEKVFTYTIKRTH